ncbi:MAG: hypothetical protein CL596_08915 [Alteromonas sp.]|nr:hypothetical protein [Alteromonas sp.]MAY21746.1 hypothetical protein [Flavobacteriaceae bacterium]|tara:strand:+ start:7530 stop:7955 length:426 start_codon:yes stop_codon:yes gene_type:complete
MRKLFFVCVLSLSVLACKEKETKAETQEGPTQMEQVMETHDELMPQMSTIAQYINKLEMTMDSTKVDTARLNAISDLKQANASMMQWMKDFGNAFESDEILNGAALSEEKKKLLNTFEANVNALKEEMNTAVENAEKTLDN